MTKSSRTADDRIARHWDRRTTEKLPERRAWWQSRAVRCHINRQVSGEPYLGTGEGLVMMFRQRLSGRVLRNGVSIGAGLGNKEMRFLSLGMVERFDLFELSTVRIAKGREIAERLGLSERVTFHQADGFSAVGPESVELVHWNNSLHHMLDVRQAVAWSERVLSPGGFFFLDDFVGPDRFQWSDRALAVATGVRSLLPRRYLRRADAGADDRLAPREVVRPSARRVARDDPSEAADSAAILPAVAEVFPQAEVLPTGGLVYHVALANLLHNFDEGDTDDLALLQTLLDLDTACTRDPELETPYATALVEKQR